MNNYIQLIDGPGEGMFVLASLFKGSFARIVTPADSMAVASTVYVLIDDGSARVASPAERAAAEEDGAAPATMSDEVAIVGDDSWISD